MKSRIITMLVAFLAIAGNAVWAAEPQLTGSGTESDPYQIFTAADLKAFRDYVNEGNPETCAKLMADIDLENEEWTPIMYTGSDRFGYEGIFNGNGHTISGLCINNSESLFVGLFGMIGSISTNFTAVITVINSSAIVEKLTVEGNVKYTGYGLGMGGFGGIAGFNVATIRDCINKASLTTESETTTAYTDYIGGICGQNKGTIKGCINEGDIISISVAGGICAQNDGIIEKCYNKGDITGKGSIALGGIAGVVSGTPNNSSSINNCYNIGTLSTDKGAVAGICTTSKTLMAVSSITNCHNYGTITTEGNEVAGICVNLNNEQLIIKNNYYLEEIADKGITNGEETGQAEMKSAEAFDNGEVLWFLQQKEGDEKVWTQGENDDYPVFISDNNKYKAYRVTFDYNCDELPDTYQYTIEYKEETVNFPADPTREGYNFLGWSEDEEGEVISSTENIPITQDITYYAQWQKIETEEPEQPGDDEDEDQGNTGIHKPQRPIKYYNIYVDTICPGLDVEVSKDVVQEGHQVSAYLTIQAECDTTGMRFEYKRGLFGYWKDLKELEGVQPGEYIIKNIYTDIYIRALDATLPEEEPTGIENLEGVKAYAKDGSIYVYTPSREEVTIISMSGAIIKHEEQVGLQSYSVSRGIYIVRIGEKVFKLKN